MKKPETAVRESFRPLAGDFRAAKKFPASVKHSLGHSAESGARIRQGRTRFGISQERLAKRAGISAGTLSEIENGIAANDAFLECVMQALRKEAIGVAKAALDLLDDELGAA